MKRTLVTVCLVLSLILWFTMRSCRRLRECNVQLSSSRTALLSGMQSLRTRFGESVAEVEQLTLTVEELKKCKARDVMTINNLNLKLKRIEMLSAASTITRLTVEVPVYDTVMVLDTARRFSWSDKWTTIEGVVNDKKVECMVTNIDTLVQVIHRVPRRLWFIRYGTKSVRQQILSRNPHTKVIYTENIRLER